MAVRIRRTPSSALIVENKPVTSHYLVELMRSIGFDTVWPVHSVRQALRTCSVTPFNVGIVQLALGEEDGGHLIAALRAWPGSVDRILAICMDEERLKRAASSGLPADAFLKMPIGRTELQQAIGRQTLQSHPAFHGDHDVVLLDT